MEPKTTEYYDWFEIQTEICKEMGIDEKFFREYHEIVGGDYKSLWLIWLEYFDGDVTNYTIVENDLGERLDIKIGWLIEEGNEWAVPFAEAVYKVWDEHGIENIKYSW